MFNTSRQIFLSLCVIGVAGTLSGCAATLSKNACLTSDWYGIGMEDGAHGQPISRLGKHRQQCGEFGVAPDLQAYQQGRAEGLDYFCTVSNGLSVGKTGHSYSGACPTELEYSFLTGYRLGREVHRVNTDMTTNRSALSAAKKEMQDEDAADTRIAELRYQARRLEREIGRLQSRLEYLDIEQQRIVVSQARAASLAND